MRHYGRRDDQWERIKNLLPGRLGTVGVTAEDNRLLVEAVLYRDCAGIPWRDPPERLVEWKNVHRRLSRWTKPGLWQRVSQALATEADNEYAMIDRTIVHAHQRSAGAPKTRFGPRDRPLTRWIDHQDPYLGECAGQSDRGLPDRGRGA